MRSCTEKLSAARERAASGLAKRLFQLCALCVRVLGGLDLPAKRDRDAPLDRQCARSLPRATLSTVPLGPEVRGGRDPVGLSNDHRSPRARSDCWTPAKIAADAVDGSYRPRSDWEPIMKPGSSTKLRIGR